MFAGMVKTYFMRICALKFAKIFDFSKPLPSILIGKTSGEEIAEARQYQDKIWLDYLANSLQYGSARVPPASTGSPSPQLSAQTQKSPDKI